MIYLSLPVGNVFGWGVCGKQLLLEMSALTPVRHVTDGFDAEAVGDELEYRHLRGLRLPERERRWMEEGRLAVDHPMLHAVGGKEMLPLRPGSRGNFNAGYVFFEENVLQPESRRQAERHYQLVVTGSSWCQEVLREHGFDAVTTVLQGIDPRLFNPSAPDKRVFPDHFVVFSGGKFELRKGQDIVIRAVQVLQDRHPDVLLVTAWWNPWPAFQGTMASSPHIEVDGSSDDPAGMILDTMARNGLDMELVVPLGMRPHATMAGIYRNTDVGLFPNRCEGGTNLVLMEYMACGKPVIATDATGHRDVLTAENSLRIGSSQELSLGRDGQLLARWPEPDLEQTVEHLEWAYQNRDALRPIGRRAGEDLASRTWRHTAQAFYELLRDRGRDRSGEGHG